MRGKYRIENGTLQGSVISPILFSIMINYVFSKVQGNIGWSLFADDRTLWKRGKNIDHIMGKTQDAVFWLKNGHIQVLNRKNQISHVH